MFLLEPSVFGWDLLLVIAMTAPAAVALLCHFWIRQHPKSRWWSRLPLRLIGLVCALGTLCVAYGSFIEPQIIVVSRYQVPFPTQKPLKIALLSDLHVGPYKGAAFVRRLVDETNAQLPDMVLIAGDLIADETSDLSGLAPLQALSAPLGVFAVTGNHDAGRFMQLDMVTPLARSDRSDAVSETLESLGLRVLRNENVTVRLGDESISIAGVDDIWSGHSSLDRALAGVPAERPLILLAHQPDVILDTLSTRADLVATGHTHGGQIRLPWYGAFGPMPSRIGRQYDQGVFTVGNDTELAISRGAGESILRSRFFAWPEVMLLQTTPRP